MVDIDAEWWTHIRDDPNVPLNNNNRGNGMRCCACDNELTDQEAVLRGANTGEYLDMCRKCLNTIKDDVFVLEPGEQIMEEKDEINPVS